MVMPFPAPPLANAHGATWEFIRNIFTGAFSGNLLSIVVLAIVALIIIRFVAARWVFVLLKQIVIFGGLAFAVWYGSEGIGERFGSVAGQAFLIIGGALVAVLFFVMLYIFFLRRGREKAYIKAGMAPEEARQRAFGKADKKAAAKSKTSMRVGAGSLQGQGLPVHYERSAKPTAAGGGSGGGASAKSAQGVDEETGRLEETLKRMNILGATKEQNLMTVSVLILVAQFGVFTSRTIPAPNAHVGMALFGIFIVAAAVFVMTAYKDRIKGLVHFVYASIFAIVLSVLLLVYWESNSWQTALSPSFYFASDGLIAMITGVAFSTLLTKGGG